MAAVSRPAGRGWRRRRSLGRERSTSARATSEYRVLHGAIMAPCVTLRGGRMIALMPSASSDSTSKQLLGHRADGASMLRDELPRGLVAAHHELAHLVVHALRGRLADADAAIGLPGIAGRADRPAGRAPTCRTRRPCGARSRWRARCRCRRRSSSAAGTALPRPGHPSGSRSAPRGTRACACDDRLPAAASSRRARGRAE